MRLEFADREYRRLRSIPGVSPSYWIIKQVNDENIKFIFDAVVYLEIVNSDGINLQNLLFSLVHKESSLILKLQLRPCCSHGFGLQNDSSCSG